METESVSLICAWDMVIPLCIHIKHTLVYRVLQYKWRGIPSLFDVYNVQLSSKNNTSYLIATP